MNYPQVTFQVRLKSRATLSDLGERVGSILGCNFEPSFDHMFDSGEGIEASCLGLQITLSHDPDIPEGEERTYILMGMLRGDIEAQWDIGVPQISINEYILGVMTICDDEGWYIPDMKEYYEEAGLEIE
ncbi:hypothetical protein NIES4071_85900 [Calothrix sp. NIES-4071]|nr:hypothetical protein NIES4071_85900 [Calothrix sp. NIES-4071]BAZ62857.1 hypothetical protein NIES4105_85830 [Calothrix sp. NIES-4105]